MAKGESRSVSAEEFDDIFRSVCHWGRWGPEDEKGTLNYALQIAAMGMCAADSLQLEELVAACEEERRYEFMVVLAPLRLPQGTGSLFNPIALF